MNIPRLIASTVIFGISLDACGASYTCSSFEYPPLVQVEGGRPAGLVVEVVEHVFQAMGHSLSIKVYPVARSLELAKAGRTDCVIALFRSTEYAPYLDYSHLSIVPQIVYFYAKRGEGATFNGDIASIKRFRIGVARKLYYGPRFEHARTELTLDEAPTVESNFKKLLAGRVDLIPSNSLTASSLLSRKSLFKDAGKIVRLPAPIESMPTYIGFVKSKGLALLRQQFDETLTQFLMSPEYQRLLVKYGVSALQHADSQMSPTRSCFPK